MRKRFEKRVYVGHILIRNNFGGVGRHFAPGLTKILGEFRERKRVRSESRSSALRALAFVTVALIATVVCVQLLAVLRVSSVSQRCSLCGTDNRCHYQTTAYINNLHIKFLNAVG